MGWPMVAILRVDVTCSNVLDHLLESKPSHPDVYAMFLVNPFISRFYPLSSLLAPQRALIVWLGTIYS